MERTYDVFSPQYSTNPYPVYAAMREHDPVWHDHWPEEYGGRWWLMRYADAVEALKDQTFSKSFHTRDPQAQLQPLDYAMLFRDPPEHTRLRGLVSQAFTPARVRDLEPRITQITQDLLDKALSKDHLDFVSEFAVPLPVMVIAELLGVPVEDRPAVRKWSNDAMMASYDETPEETDRRIQSGWQGLASYFHKLVAMRRADPQPDLLGGMIAARDLGDRLDETELIGTCVLLLVAGHETTVNLLGNGMLALLQHPDQSELLHQKPQLVTSAVEEMLRYESPVQTTTFRVATRPLTFSGQSIQPMEEVVICLGSANHDPAVFPDPERFDVTREPNRHLAFAIGSHFCLGAPLARAEARIAFSCLLEWLPRLKMVDETPRWNPGNFMRGLRDLRLQVA